MIRGYDDWKAEVLEDPDPVTRCVQCNAPLYEGDVIYTIDGGICEDCLEDSYRKTL